MILGIVGPIYMTFQLVVTPNSSAVGLCVAAAGYYTLYFCDENFSEPLYAI